MRAISGCEIFIDCGVEGDLSSIKAIVEVGDVAVDDDEGLVAGPGDRLAVVDEVGGGEVLGDSILMKSAIATFARSIRDVDVFCVEAIA